MVPLPAKENGAAQEAEEEKKMEEEGQSPPEGCRAAQELVFERREGAERVKEGGEEVTGHLPLWCGVSVEGAEGRGGEGGVPVQC